MDDREEQGMDTTYVGIMVVAFLVIAALAVDIGYLYVSEDDLQNAAESSALAGAQALEQRIHARMRSDPDKLKDVFNDQVQASARSAAIDAVLGKHKATALIEITNNNTNRLTTENDVTVGFWNVSTQTYVPGGIPVNAIQVRTRRTAESESVGLGSLGSILAKLSGPQKFNYTPEAIAAFPARAGANFALCVDACDKGCAYPNACAIPERKMIRDAWDAGKDLSASNRYAYTSLLHPPSGDMKLSDQVCMDLPPQAACGKQIFTVRDASDNTLRDMASMMYNPNVDTSNKEYDTAGKVTGWWVIAPVTDCPPARQENVFEQHMVTKYALVRISRICVEGESGCQQNGTSFKAPASACGSGNGLYIDHISCIGCGSRSMPEFPGLRPVLVK
jgi:Flp pilus assembly protein TadG